MNTNKIRTAINNPPGVTPKQAFDWLHEALDEIDHLKDANINLRENVDLLRREKKAFVDRIRELEVITPLNNTKLVKNMGVNETWKM